MAIVEREVGMWLFEQTINLFDVRSPQEFKQGHIPSGINIPLFNDQERKEIGTLYKKNGPKLAILHGLQIVGPKLRSLVEQFNSLAKGKKLVIHCWRGGKRSSSVAWLLSNVGYEVTVLSGGYKAYRQFQSEFYTTNQFKIIVLGGRTGGAKTQLLRGLAEKGEQIIDLEALAKHKGSAFGGIGEQDQETNEQFENNLFSNLLRLNLNHWIWIENESRTIGRNYIPELFWKHIKQASLINLERDLEFRINHLINLYQQEDDESLMQSFEKIRKRLGHEATQNAIDFIKQKNYSAAARIALNYYDKCYDYNLAINVSNKIVKLKLKQLSNLEVLDILLNYKQNHFGI